MIQGLLVASKDLHKPARKGKAPWPVVSGEALGRMDKLLAEHFGVDTTTAGCIIVAVLAVVWFVRQNSGPSDPPPTVELHPKHLEYIRAKEAVYCKSNNEGKAIRCIIDYLREEKDSDARAILDEKPAFATKEGFEAFEFDVHDLQFEYLAETCNIKVGLEDGPERYKVRTQRIHLTSGGR